MSKGMIINVKNKNYSVDRNDVYYGRLIRIDAASLYDGNNVAQNGGSAKMDIIAWHLWRDAVLFIINENRADDLLYDSPKYPVLGVSSDKDCYIAKAVIKDAYCLSDLLQHLGYYKTLGYKDITHIEKNVFSGWLGKKSFDVVKKIDDEQLFNILQSFKENKNAFKPHKQEGKIRDLGKFASLF